MRQGESERRNRQFPMLGFVLLSTWAVLHVTNGRCAGVTNRWAEDDEQMMLEKAEAGDPHYQAVIASYFRTGRAGFPRHTAEATKWSARSVDQDYPLGLFERQFLMRDDRGVRWPDMDFHSVSVSPANRDEAVGLRDREPEALCVKCIPGLKALSEQGCTRATHAMGTVLLNGWGGNTPDPDAAATWYAKGGEQGSPESHHDAACVYLYYLGKPAEAFRHFLRAAQAGHPAAMGRVGGMLLEGRPGVPKDEKTGAEWVKRAVEKNDGWGYAWLGWMYQHGATVEPDETKAREAYARVPSKDPAVGTTWWRYLARDWADSGVYGLDRYGAGRGTKQEQLALLKRRAASGNADAMYRLGIIAHSPSAPRASTAWYMKAAEHGDKRAILPLADNLILDSGATQPELESARKWILSLGDTNSLEIKRRIDNLDVRLGIQPDPLPKELYREWKWKDGDVAARGCFVSVSTNANPSGWVRIRGRGTGTHELGMKDLVEEQKDLIRHWDINRQPLSTGNPRLVMENHGAEDIHITMRGVTNFAIARGAMRELTVNKGAYQCSISSRLPTGSTNAIATEKLIDCVLDRDQRWIIWADSITRNSLARPWECTRIPLSATLERSPTSP